MRRVTTNLFPVKKIPNRFICVTIVESSYMNTNMCKFDSLHGEENKAQSDDSSEAHSKPRAVKSHENDSFQDFFVI